MFWLYLYRIISLFLLPIATFRLLIKSLKLRVHRVRLNERFGFIKPPHRLPYQKKTIWLHCVSVGEFLALRGVIERLIQKKDFIIIITTTTPSAANIVVERYTKEVKHYYFPFDVSFIVSAFVRKTQPDICVIMETEIWPNLIYHLSKKAIPIILANARLSKRSMKKYLRFATFSRFIMNHISIIAAQNESSMAGFLALGVTAQKVQNIGNIKFDIDNKKSPVGFDEIKNIIGTRRVVLFASTHAGEEVEILKSYVKYQTQLKNTLIVVVPRHSERIGEIEKLLTKYKLLYLKRTQNKKLNSNINILLGDTLGELMAFYKICHITFIGGTLTPVGGHNMLEPAALKKCILYAKHTENFSEISRELIKLNAAIQVQNANELFTVIVALLGDEKKVNTLAENAHHFFLNKQGASKRLYNMIDTIIHNKKTPPFIATVPYIYRHMDIAQIDINDLRSHLPKPAGKIKDLKKSDHIIIYPPVLTRARHMLISYVKFKYKIFRKVKCKISLMIAEPKQSMSCKELYRGLWLVRFVFHHVFVRYQALENKYSNVLVVPITNCWVGQLNNNDFFKKDKLLSIIASEQNHLPGHRLRHQIIREVKHQDMAILGSAYRPFKDKKDGLLPYRFSIVIENCQEDDYFSEKLADSFACKTVPIYWGCPNIDYYFDTNGMIIFNTIDELKTILNKLKYDDYQKFIPSLEKNRQTALSLANTSKVIADKLNEEK